jgi:CBS domain-containing protein
MSTIGSLVADREVYTLSAEQTVKDAARYMTERRVGAASVLEGRASSASFRSATS